MSIKVCNIRLDKKHLQADQDQMNAFLDSVNVKLTSSNFVTTGTTDYWSVLIFYEAKKPMSSPLEENNLVGEDKQKYINLKAWRNNKAAELNMPHYVISHNSELIKLATSKPKTLSELKKIKGFGETKVAKYGKELLEVIQS